MFAGSLITPWRQCNAVSPAVTATQTGAGTHNGMALTVKVVNNATIQITGPQYQSSFIPGATGTKNADAPAEVQIAPWYTGSWVYGAVNRNNASTAWTPDAASVFSQNVSDATNGAAYGTFRSDVMAIPAFTVTATQGGATAAGMAMTIVVVTGAAASQPGTVTGVSSTTPSAPITPTATGSQVYGALIGVSSNVYHPLASTVFESNLPMPSVGALQYIALRSAATTTAGTPVTLGATSDVNSIAVALCEIEAAGTLAEDSSAPPPVGGSPSGTSVATASFTPPAGSLLVAMISANAGSGVVTMAVTDTSGLGLSWVEQSKQTVSDDGYAGVWTAQMPAATGFTTSGLAVTTGATNGDGASGAAGGVAVAEIPASGLLAEDSSAPAPVTTTSGTSVTTANFTPPMGSLLVAQVATAGSAVGVQLTDDNGMLTWVEQAKWASGTSGYAGIWTAVVVCG